MTLYYEDLALSDTFNAGEYTLSKEEMIEFAERFDPQPFHVDEDAAAESLFGELVASGLHTLCLASRLAIEEVMLEVDNQAGRGMGNIRWDQPVRPNETISVTVKVLEKTPADSPDYGYVDFELQVDNDDDERALTFEVYNIVGRRSEECVSN